MNREAQFTYPKHCSVLITQNSTDINKYMDASHHIFKTICPCLPQLFFFLGGGGYFFFYFFILILFFVRLQDMLYIGYDCLRLPTLLMQLVILALLTYCLLLLLVSSKDFACMHCILFCNNAIQKPCFLPFFLLFQKEENWRKQQGN